MDELKKVQLQGLYHKTGVLAARHLKFGLMQLGAGEKLLGCGGCNFDRRAGAWLVTDRSVILASRPFLVGSKIKRIPVAGIIETSQNRGFVYTLDVHTSADKTTLLLSLEGLSIVDGLIAKARAIKGSGSAEVPVDNIAQIERLAALKDKGLLTDEEFTEQKRRILEKE